MILVWNVCADSAYAQLTSELSADKAEYACGETITVTFKLMNETNALVTVPASCPPLMTFDGVEFVHICLASEFSYYFNPGSWRTWTFEIDPTDTGLPSFTGEHTVSVDYDVYAETVLVTAPEFLGGTLVVEIEAGTPTERVDEIRASVQGETVHSRTRHLLAPGGIG